MAVVALGRQNWVVAAAVYLLSVSLQKPFVGPYPVLQIHIWCSTSSQLPCQPIYPSSARASLLWVYHFFFLQELHTLCLYVHYTGRDLLTALSRLSNSEPPSVIFTPGRFSSSWVLCHGLSLVHRIHYNCLDASVLSWKPPVMSLPFWRVHFIPKWASIISS